MIETPEEMEVMAHVSSRCRCTVWKTCERCTQTATGFIMQRNAALTRLIKLEYVTYAKEIGFIATEAGLERYIAMDTIMKKISNSAGVVRPSTTTPEQDQDFLGDLLEGAINV